VEEAGDNIARNKFTLATVLQARPTARNVRDVETARRYLATTAVGQYCTARKDFIQRSSVQEFRKRATDHCKNDPPSAQGLSGAQVPLPDQCRAVYATGCP
jgi:hypothetical protein